MLDHKSVQMTHYRQIRESLQFLMMTGNTNIELLEVQRKQDELFSHLINYEAQEAIT